MHRPIQLGPFVLHATYRTGGSGTVWRARHGDRDVAVKVVRPDLASTSHARSLLDNEIRQGLRLDHPNIARILGHGQVDAAAAQASGDRLVAGTPWLASEFASRGSLSEILGHLDWEASRGILAQLLGALAHAHARHLLHRDLKPGNVMFDEVDGRTLVKLVDFGLATHLRTEQDWSGPAFGTPRYMAPEQIPEGPHRAALQGPWTDLYAVGCIAYELVCLSPPFRGQTRAELLRRHLETPPPALAPAFDVPDELEPWVLRLLQKRPRDRYRHAADALAALPGAGRTRPHAASRRPLPVDSTRSTTLDVSLEERTAPAPRHRAPVSLSWRLPRDAGAGDMTGREQERDRLWDALCKVHADGRGRVLSLVGRRGSGSSKLSRWLGERAHELGMANVVAASCGEGQEGGIERALALELRCTGLPFQERTTRIARVLEDAREGEAEDAVTLAMLLGDSSALPWELPSSARREALVRGLTRQSDRPLLLVLDGLDAGTRALVEALRDTQSLVVCVPGDAAPIGEVLEVPLMSDAELGDLLDRLTPLSPLVRARILAHAGGLPGFAVELVRSWREQGVLNDAGELAADAEVPSSTHALVQQRLAFLWDGDPMLHGLVEVAALLGRRVDHADLEHGARLLGATNVAGTLRPLLSAGILSGTPDRGWQFDHAVVWASIRQALHASGRHCPRQRTCAEILPAHTGARRRDQRLSHHLIEAGEDGAARVHAVRAAATAVRVGELDEAERLLSIAAALPMTAAQRVEVTTTRMRLDIMRGDLDAATVEGDRVLEEVEHLEIPEVARLLRTLGLAHQKARRFAIADGLLLQAHELAEDTDDALTAARCIMNRGTVARMRGRTSQAVRHLQEALTCFEELESLQGVAEALTELAHVELEGDSVDLDAAATKLERAISTYGELPHAHGEAMALNALGQTRQEQGERAEGRRLFLASRDAFLRIGSRARLYPTLNLGLSLAEDGLVDDANTYLDQAEALTPANARRVRFYVVTGRVLCAAHNSDEAGLLALLEEAESLVPRRLDPELARYLRTAAMLTSGRSALRLRQLLDVS
jgi:tetratricopeptide (TPR) repeat protein